MTDLIAILLLIAGSICVVIAIVSLINPQIIDWLNDHTNLRAAKRAAEAGNDWGLRHYDQNLRGLRIALPLVLLLFGLALLVGGLRSIV